MCVGVFLKKKQLEFRSYPDATCMHHNCRTKGEEIIIRDTCCFLWTNAMSGRQDKSAKQYQRKNVNIFLSVGLNSFEHMFWLRNKKK